MKALMRVDDANNVGIVATGKLLSLSTMIGKGVKYIDTPGKKRALTPTSML